MISLPALPSANTEKPVKTAGFARLDSVFASILEGEAGSVEQAGGKILPEGGKELPEALPPEVLALQVVRKALHGRAKPDPKPESETTEPDTDASEPAADSETAEAAPKGAEIIEAIALAAEVPIKFEQTSPVQAPKIEGNGEAPKQAPVPAQFKGQVLQMSLSSTAVVPETVTSATETKPAHHAPLQAAQALLAALRQPGRTAAKATTEQSAAPEQAIAAVATQTVPAAVQDAARPARASRPQPQHELTVELVKDAKPSVVAKDAVARPMLSSALSFTPGSQLAAVDAASPAPAVKPAADFVNAQQAVRPHEFTALVDRLVEARESARPANANLTVMHADFGQVSLQFGQDNGNLTVSLASNDPGFLPAVTAAAATADASANGDSGTQNSRRDEGGHSARTAADNTNTAGGERGTGRDGAERWQGREGRIRSQPHFAARAGRKPNNGIFA